MGDSEFYSTKEICNKFKIGTRTLYDWRKRDGFPEPVANRPGSKCLYSRNAVETWTSKSFLQGA